MIGNETRLSDILCQYGAAFRNDWSEMDGRTVRSDLEMIASYIDEGRLVLDEEEALNLRTRLDLCPDGQGHWATWCDQDCK